VVQTQHVVMLIRTRCLLDRYGRSAYSVVSLKIRLKLGHGVLGWNLREYHRFVGCVLLYRLP